MANLPEERGWPGPRPRVDTTLTWFARTGEEGRSPDEAVRGDSQHGPLDPKEIELATQRGYRKFTARQKLEVVLAGLRGDTSVKDLCREHEIAETLYYSWRDKLLEGGKLALAGTDERQAKRTKEDPRARAGARAQDLRARDRGGTVAGWGLSERVARSRELVAKGRPGVHFVTSVSASTQLPR